MTDRPEAVESQTKVQHVNEITVEQPAGWNWHDLSPADFVTIVLGAVTIALAVLGVFIAIVTFAGWRQIIVSAKSAAKTAAEKSANDKIEEYLRSSDFQLRVKSIAGELLKHQIEGRVVEHSGALQAQKSAASPEQMRD